MKRIIGVIAVAAALAGCASGGPVAMGNGEYFITKKSAACGFSSGQESEADLLREANAFCAKQGKEIETIKADASHGVPFARCASAEVHFRCVGSDQQHVGSGS